MHLKRKRVFSRDGLETRQGPWRGECPFHAARVLRLCLSHWSSLSSRQDPSSLRRPKLRYRVSQMFVTRDSWTQSVLSQPTSSFSTLHLCLQSCLFRSVLNIFVISYTFCLPSSSPLSFFSTSLSRSFGGTYAVTFCGSSPHLLPPLIASFILDQNILLGILFSDTLDVILYYIFFFIYSMPRYI